MKKNMVTFSEQTINYFSADRREKFEWLTPNTMTELHFKCCKSKTVFWRCCTKKVFLKIPKISH